MPQDKAGAFHMNPANARMHDTAAPPVTEEPTATVTLTKNADGTITCDDGTGQPSTHDNMQEALDYAGMKLGGGEEISAGGDIDMGTGSDEGDY